MVYYKNWILMIVVISIIACQGSGEKGKKEQKNIKVIEGKDSIKLQKDKVGKNKVGKDKVDKNKDKADDKVNSKVKMDTKRVNKKKTVRRKHYDVMAEKRSNEVYSPYSMYRKRFRLTKVNKCIEVWMEINGEGKDLEWYLYAGNTCNSDILLEDYAIYFSKTKNVTVNNGEYIYLTSFNVPSFNRKVICWIAKMDKYIPGYFTWRVVNINRTKKK